MPTSQVALPISLTSLIDNGSSHIFDRRAAWLLPLEAFQRDLGGLESPFLDSDVVASCFRIRASVDNFVRVSGCYRSTTWLRPSERLVQTSQARVSLAANSISV